MKTLVRKKNIYFFIEEQMFIRLKNLIVKHNEVYPKGRNHLKLDVAVFFIHHIDRLSLINKDKQYKGYIRLKAEYLKKYKHDYAQYIRFLLENKFIARIPFDLKKKKCYGYKIVRTKNSRSFRRSIVKYCPEDYTFRKKVMNDEQTLKSKRAADRKSPYLTKWLTSEHIYIHYDEALDYIHSLNIEDSKLYNKRYCIEALNAGQIYYGRSGADDRLHSNLTN